MGGPSVSRVLRPAATVGLSLLGWLAMKLRKKLPSSSKSVILKDVRHGVATRYNTDTSCCTGVSFGAPPTE